MEFKDVLNSYMEQLGCTANELAASSGLSAATISRFRSGERVPKTITEAVEKLAKGIAELSKVKQGIQVTEREVRNALFEKDSVASIDRETLRKNFVAMLKKLAVNASDLSRYLSYDPSYLSRIRNGERRPANPQEFAAKVSCFIARHYNTPDQLEQLAVLTGMREAVFKGEQACEEALMKWLTDGENISEDPTTSFLQKLDDFDLDEYIRILHFDHLKMPDVSHQPPVSAAYTGLKQMMTAELDFLNLTLLSGSEEAVTMYSNLPMDEMAKDPDFPKVWMLGLAMLLKKGLHLNQIHCLDRSFEDMMLGLESWIPLYMTGQISPYYLKGTRNSPFSNLLKVSGAAALAGEAIAEYHGEGRYYLTQDRAELAYYKKRAERLLSKATPLMDIYRRDSAADYRGFLTENVKFGGTRRFIRSSLPLYTASDEFIRRILQSNRVPGKDQERIIEYAAFQRRDIEEILSHDPIFEEYPVLSKEEFERYPMTLSLAGTFYEKNIVCTYEQYAEHLGYMKQFSRLHENYSTRENPLSAFRHIQILIHEGRWVMVSKEKTPAIHFVIWHPAIRAAIENMIMPILEKSEQEA